MPEINLKRISLFLGIIMTIGAMVTYVANSEWRPVMAGEHQVLVMQVQTLQIQTDNHALEGRIYDLQKRIWMFEDRYRDSEMPPEIRDELRELNREMEDKKSKIKPVIKETE